MKTLWKVAVILGVLFISLGDRFLPQPLADYSTASREQLQQAMLGLMPTTGFRRPSEDREKQVDEFNRKVAPDSNS